MNANSIDVLSKQRVRLDSILNGMKELPKARGTATAITSLEKGRMYIGEILLGLGKTYPYDKTKTATNPEGIQEAVDKSTVNWKVVGNEIQDLNNYREALQNEVDNFLKEIFDVGVSNYGVNNGKDAFILSCNLSEAYRGLKEARMWLGVRLGEIRDIHNK